MTVSAPAKINLGLRITAKRADGYHDIDTVFHRTGLTDTLEFQKRERGITLTCSDPAIPSDERNLCVRAARALFERAGYDGGVHIDLVKHIPDGGGLGGGSSDAASVLRALPALCDIAIDDAELHRLATAIGSDVPYFLHSGSAHATGRGEILDYFDLVLPYHILLAHPGIRVPTAWAYGMLVLNPNRPLPDLREVLTHHPGDREVLRRDVTNDFEAPVFAAYPQIRALKEAMRDHGALFALMSGSGASVFGLFEQLDDARACIEALPEGSFVHITEAV